MNRLALAVFTVGLLVPGCSLFRQDKMLPIGVGVQASLVIYFKVGTSEEQINGFSKEVLSRPDPQGRGVYNPEGVRTFLRLSAVEGHEAIAITFFPNASAEQREKLKSCVTASPLVYKGLENVAQLDFK